MYGKITSVIPSAKAEYYVSCPVCDADYVIDALNGQNCTDKDPLITMSNPTWDHEYAYITIHMVCECCNVPIHTTIRKKIDMARLAVRDMSPLAVKEE